MKLRTVILAGACMLALAGFAAAQSEAATPTQVPVATTTLAADATDITVSGEVVSSTSTALVIDSDAGQEMTFELDPLVTPASSFRVGERVTVKYHSLSGGTVYRAANVVAETEHQVEPQKYEVASADLPSLPDTATGLPLLALLGLVAVGGAVAVHVVRS